MKKVELNLVDDKADPAMRNAEVLGANISTRARRSRPTPGCWGR